MGRFLSSHLSLAAPSYLSGLSFLPEFEESERDEGEGEEPRALSSHANSAAEFLSLNQKAFSFSSK